MKQYKGAVFFDFDGTLVDETEKLYSPTEKTIESLKQLKENGFLVGLSTGRSKFYVPKTNIDFECYVTSNGAFVSVENEVIYDNVIDQKTLDELFDFFKKSGMGYMPENQEMCYLAETGREEFEKMLNWFNIDVSKFLPIPADKKVKANKLMFSYTDPSVFTYLKEKYGDEFNITKHRTTKSGDMGKKCHTKASGIKKVLEYLKLDLKDTYAFGDSDNDIEMLSSVGHSVGMGKHTDSVEKVAEFITDTVSNEGIYKGLKHFNLI